MNNLIAISGKMGAGKDLLAQIIRYINWRDIVVAEGVLFKDQFVNFENWSGKNVKKKDDFEIKKYADTLKDTVCLWLNCTREQLEDRDFKDKPLPRQWDKFVLLSHPDHVYDYEVDAAKASIELYGIRGAYKRVSMTCRILMQRLGTEGGRESIHQDIWVNTLFNNYSKSKKWLITDCRFPNEAKAVLARGGVVLRIERPNVIQTCNGIHMHPSETALDKFHGFSKIFINNGSIQDLVNQVEEWMH